MNNLPSELLHDIFIQIPLADRLVCTLVCRYWYNHLCMSSLLHEIDIKSDKKFNNFINMLQHLPDRASQVEIMKLNISDLPFDKRILYNMLPNLHEFHFWQNSYKDQLENYFSQPFKLINPKSKLEIIKDSGQCELTRQLLMVGTCTRLRHLEIELNFIGNPREEIFNHLKSTPNLKTLILCQCKIGIDDHEIIHKNTSALEILDIKGMILIAGETPKKMIPATSVTTLGMFVYNIEDDQDISLDWLKYLSKKYINLTRFNYFDQKMYNFSSLKSMKIYQDGLIPIYRNLRILIPHYQFLDFSTESNPFITLDEFGVGVSKLKLIDNRAHPIFEQLAGSNQTKYLETLILDNTAIATPIMLQNFVSLNKIHINTGSDHHQWDCNLSNYFNAFPPTLTSFAACFRDAKLEYLPSVPNNVQNLSLECSTLYPQLGEAISTCFTKLNNLHLRGHVTENFDINLPNNHFKNLTIDVHDNPDQTIGFSIMNSSMPQPQYYIKRGNKTLKNKFKNYSVFQIIPFKSNPTSILDSKSKDLKPATYQEIQKKVIIKVSVATATVVCCNNSHITTQR